MPSYSTRKLKSGNVYDVRFRIIDGHGQEVEKYRLKNNYNLGITMRSLNKREYEYLIKIRNEEPINKDSIFYSLFRNGYVKRNKSVGYPYRISNEGNAATEEYERKKEKDRQQQKALELDEEANQIAKEANNISEKSRRLSLAAIIISSGSALISIVGIIVNALI